MDWQPLQFRKALRKFSKAYERSKPSCLDVNEISTLERKLFPSTICVLPANFAFTANVQVSNSGKIFEFWFACCGKLPTRKKLEDLEPNQLIACEENQKLKFISFLVQSLYSLSQKSTLIFYFTSLVMAFRISLSTLDFLHSYGICMQY
jgi:hypothetical protein